jgi:hypothetical protein
MSAWSALLGTLGLNYWQHKHGKPTLCSSARRWLPRSILIAGWAALTAWLIPHVLRGYPKKELPWVRSTS